MISVGDYVQGDSYGGLGPASRIKGIVSAISATGDTGYLIVPEVKGRAVFVGNMKKLDEKPPRNLQTKFKRWKARPKKVIGEQTPTYSYAMGGPHDSGDIATKTSGKGSYERIPDPLYDRKKLTFKDFLKKQKKKDEDAKKS
jgi:hypothetical protein